MKVVRAWYVSKNDWNVPHVHGPLFNAPCNSLGLLYQMKRQGPLMSIILLNT